jgi:acyl carrier protein
VDEALQETIGERREVLAVVRTILIENLKVDRTPEEIDPDVPLFGTGIGLDSVDAVEMMVALESKLGIQLPEDMHAPAHLRTVGSLVELILSHRRGGALPEMYTPRDEGDAPMRALRSKTAWSRHDDVLAVRVAGDPFPLLDPLVPTDLYLRDGQMKQTLILDERGHPIADAYVAHDDGALWLLVEGMSASDLRAWCTFEGAELRFEEHEVISIHGPWAWELGARLLGEDLVSLPYLNLFHFEGGTCFRGGKTGEFGYDFLIPRRDAGAFADRLRDVGQAFGLEELGRAHLAQAKRESFFFDPSLWRAEDVTPIELQLGWRVSTRKRYVGSAAIEARRPARERATCLLSETELAAGAVVSTGVSSGASGDEPIGRVVHGGYCAARGAWVSHALIAIDHAEAELDRYTVDGVKVRTVSPPVLANKSLVVDPRRHSYFTHLSEGAK